MLQCYFSFVSSAIPPCSNVGNLISGITCFHRNANALPLENLFSNELLQVLNRKKDNCSTLVRAKEEKISMYPVPHFRWRVKAFFSRIAAISRRRKLRRVKISTDKASESSEQNVTRKRKNYEKRRRRFKEGNVESPTLQQQNVIHAPTKDYKDVTKVIKGAFSQFEQEALQLRIINLYLELLKEREKRDPTNFLKCHFFNTFFYVKLTYRGNYSYNAVKRWTRHRKLGYNLLECDSILVPIHKFYQQHWCLGIINIKEKKIQYYDSLGGRNHDDCVFNVLAQYIKDEAEDKCRKDLDVNKWKREYVENLPKQGNNYDCGVFLIKFADFHSRGIPFNFTQANIPYFRQRTAKEILRLRAE